MNALSLSVSSPRKRKGNLLRSPLIASTISACSRTGNAMHSVQADTMSVSTNVCTKLPSVVGPECVTKSIRFGGSSLAPATSTFSHILELTIDGGSTHGEKLSAQAIIDLQMSMSLHRLQELRH